MVRFRFTITGYYVVETTGYSDGDPSRMAEIDQEQYDSGSISACEIIGWSDEPVEVRIEPS